jgi:hypothetical protein
MWRDLYIHPHAAAAHRTPCLRFPYFYNSHNIADSRHMFWCSGRHENIVTELRNTVPRQSCFTCTYQSSLRVFGNARVHHWTYSMTFFLGFGREKEREGRAQTWVKPVNGLEKRRRRRCVMQKGSKRKRGRYLYTLPTHTRSSIPRTHIHATEHVAVCSIFRMFAT